ncbi:MAG: aminotransferase class V-fold PLP-dependent enzyme [Desulfobulbaceae bacterium]|nr:aminotransferase class V-fold PLP-dependent enzyme [Desulfobulbaceae bacterium]
MHIGVDTKSHPWERTANDFFDDAEMIRSLASSIFGGDADGYAVIPSASYGLSTAARAIEPIIQHGDNILVIDKAFPSNYLPWERIANETRSNISIVPTPADGDWTKAILERIEKDVKVVAVPNCHWTNGAFIDLKTVGQACRHVKALLAIDATQSLGAMPLLIEDIKPDFLVASGYKWLLCPYGFSLLYVSEQWRNARPLEETWIARDNAQDFTALVEYSKNYMPGSRRFEVGEKCTPTILPGAIAAFERIKEWGVDNIAKTLMETNEKISTHIKSLGFQLPVVSQRSPHMFGAQIPKFFQGNLVSELLKRKIFISQRGSAVRFAPHLHVNSRDIDRLLEALDEIIQ